MSTDPIRKELARPEILRSLLSLVDNRPNSASAKPVYFVGMHTLRPRELNVVEEEWDERLELGETIAGWTMNVLEDVLSEGESFRFFVSLGTRKTHELAQCRQLSVPVGRRDSHLGLDSPLYSNFSLDLRLAADRTPSFAFRTCYRIKRSG